MATDAIAVYAPIWLEPSAERRMVMGSDGPMSYRAYMQDSVEQRIVGRLAKAGILCQQPLHLEELAAA